MSEVSQTLAQFVESIIAKRADASLRKALTLADVPAIEPLLAHENTYVRSHMARLFYDLVGIEAAIAHLGVAKERHALRRLVFADLQGRGHAAIDTLIRLAEDPDASTRSEAVSALNRLEDPRIVPVFLERLSDSYAIVRTVAAYGLAERGDPRGDQALIQQLAQGEEVTFWIKHRKPAGALPHLLAITRDDRRYLGALDALSVYEGGAPRLLAVLQDKTERIFARTTAASGLLDQKYEPAKAALALFAEQDGRKMMKRDRKLILSRIISFLGVR